MMEPAPRSPENDRLLEKALAGDTAAFGQLAENFRPYLVVVASRLLGKQRPHDCSSIVQEAFLVGFQRLAQLRGRTPEEFLGWLAAIVRNRAKDHRGRTNPAGPLPERSGGEELLPAPGLTPSKDLARREEAARLRAAMERLPHDYRQVLEMRNFERLRYQAIASRMNRSLAAVRWLWLRAVRKLRDELGE